MKILMCFVMGDERYLNKLIRYVEVTRYGNVTNNYWDVLVQDNLK